MSMLIIVTLFINAAARSFLLGVLISIIRTSYFAVICPLVLLISLLLMISRCNNLVIQFGIAATLGILIGMGLGYSTCILVLTIMRYLYGAI